MLPEIQHIPEKEKRVPAYMTPEVQMQRAFIQALVGAVKEVVGNINVNLQIPEDKREIYIASDNLEKLAPKEVVIPSSVRVNNLEGVIQKLIDLEKCLVTLNAKESPKVEIPSFPTEISVKNFPESKPVDLSAISSLLEDIKTALSATEGVEPVRVENISDIKIPEVDYDLIASIVASMAPEAPEKLDLSVFDEIKKAVQLVATPMPSFVDPDGSPNRAKVDSNRVMRTSSDGYKKRLTYTVTGETEYVGMAVADALTSEAKWQIQKLTYDVNDNLIALYFANDSDKFMFVWDDKEDYFA
jgi:hypothetical protein